jgi:phage baseplate assembly protein W
MTIQGSALRHPIQPDRRGTLGSTSSINEIIEGSLMAIIETRQGERVMLPDYGIPDFVFSVIDAGFTARMAYFIESQALKYEPLIDSISVTIGFLDVDESFIPGFVENQQIAAVSVEYIPRGQNTPRNLVFPTWGLRQLSEVA